MRAPWKVPAEQPERSPVCPRHVPLGSWEGRAPTWQGTRPSPRSALCSPGGGGDHCTPALTSRALPAQADGRHGPGLRAAPAPADRHPEREYNAVRECPGLPRQRRGDLGGAGGGRQLLGFGPWRTEVPTGDRHVLPRGGTATPGVRSPSTSLRCPPLPGPQTPRPRGQPGQRSDGGTGGPCFALYCIATPSAVLCFSVLGSRHVAGCACRFSALSAPRWAVQGGVLPASSRFWCCRQS